MHLLKVDFAVKQILASQKADSLIALLGIGLRGSQAKTELIEHIGMSYF